MDKHVHICCIHVHVCMHIYHTVHLVYYIKLMLSNNARLYSSGCPEPKITSAIT